jgi:hypothetical protein
VGRRALGVPYKPFGANHGLSLQNKGALLERGQVEYSIVGSFIRHFHETQYVLSRAF